MSNRSYPSPARVFPQLPVSDVLREKPEKVLYVSPSDTVYRAVERMAEEGIGALLVMQRGALLGIVSERDYTRRVVLKGRRSQETRVSEIMTGNVMTVTPRDSLQHCMELMTEHHFRHLPVVDAGRVVGVVTMGDLVREVLQHQCQTIEELERYVTGEPNLRNVAVL